MEKQSPLQGTSCIKSRTIAPCVRQSDLCPTNAQWSQHTATEGTYSV